MVQEKRDSRLRGNDVGVCRNTRNRAGQEAALLGVHRLRTGDDAHGPRAQLSGHLALPAPRPADPRSFCIQKTLQDIAHGAPVEQNLMFAGHAAFRFKSDPFYSNGFVPTVKQLVDRILTGA